jgi:hypothetical protein
MADQVVVLEDIADQVVVLEDMAVPVVVTMKVKIMTIIANGWMLSANRDKIFQLIMKYPILASVVIINNIQAITRTLQLSVRYSSFVANTRYN